MRRAVPPRPHRGAAAALVAALALVGSTSGCGSSPAEQPLDQSKVDTKITKGFDVTKQGMRDRMKQMRKPGGAPR